uniref:ATP synthase complex subunit 8 n=1 Tax=Hydrobasileus croceus TaxID=1168636 RepID=A0A0A0V9N8_9ODON|nr:ATP synthase F0 subunit 8 [Hydrobasileus croceus]AIW64831.1 ATP synthase F0 subunit 8 [Hydrobasileus croceus]
MPQMAPMSWIMLFMFFSLMLVLFSIMNYYLYSPKIPLMDKNKSLTIKMKNWKW